MSGVLILLCDGVILVFNMANEDYIVELTVNGIPTSKSPVAYLKKVIVCLSNSESIKDAPSDAGVAVRRAGRSP